jgi:hypothetical protein
MIKHPFTYLFAVLSATLVVSACSDEKETPGLPIPTIGNIELGLGNNEIAVIGQDFHFEADVVAGDKIETVRIQIRQITGETYAGSWSFEVVWDQYKNLKNANVHEHFDIPEDAVEGKYEVVITVSDQNGQNLKVIKNLAVYTGKNLPATPDLTMPEHGAASHKAGLIAD